MNDTTAHMREKQLEIIFKMTNKQRFEEGIKMIDFVRNVVENSIKKQNPTISKIDLKIAVFKRYYGNDFDEQEQKRIIDYFIDNQ